MRAGQLRSHSQGPWGLMRSKGSKKSRPRAEGTNSRAYGKQEPTGREEPGLGYVAWRLSSQVRAPEHEGLAVVCGGGHNTVPLTARLA